MTDEKNTEKKEEQAKIKPVPTDKTQVANPSPPPIVSISSNEQITAKSGSEKPKDECDKSKEISVRVLEDDELRPFEAQTLSWARAGFYLGLTTLIIAVLTLGIFYRQLNVMQTQLQDSETDSRISDLRALQQRQSAQAQVDAITRQMRQDQRPYMTVNLDFPRTDKGQQIIQLFDNQPLTFPLLFTSTGKTPARKVESALFVEVVKNGKEAKFDSPDIPPFKFGGGIFYSGIPASSFVTRVDKSGKDRWLKPEELASLKAGEAYVAVYGTINYFDIFDGPHWTKVCMAIPFSTVPYTAKKCSEYNNVDGN